MLSSGKKLDALVAEKVLGCKVVRYNLAVTSAGCECPGTVHAADECSDELPSYSTDRTAAWEVVEAMRVHGFSFKLWQPDSIVDGAFSPEMNGFSVVSFICKTGPCEKHGNLCHNHHGAYDVEADTLPVAICKAALVAMKCEDATCP